MRKTIRIGLSSSFGGAAIGFFVAFQAASASNHWLFGLVGGLAGLILGASCGVAVMALRRKLHQASLKAIVSGIIGLALGLGLAELLFSAISSFLDFLSPPAAMIMRIIVTIGAAYMGAAIAIEKSRGFSVLGLVRTFRKNR